MSHHDDVSSRPLLIGGMHRSGTSLTASLLAGAGLDLGPELLGANPSNPLGHFEDVGFFHFHRRALVAQGLGSEGYTAAARGRVPFALEPEALALVASRRRTGVAWGWKEPRTTLFLDFWQERLPDARHLFVFRRPWEVADSLFRRGDETFALNPAFALDVWTHYNRLILDFARRHPARCLVFEISQVIADPAAVVAAVRSRLDVPVGVPDRRYRDALFSRDDGPTRATLVRSLAPEAWRTYQELRDLAGSPGADDVRSEGTVGDCALLEWARASRDLAQARETAERVRIETAERFRAEAERIRAETVAHVRAGDESRGARRFSWTAVARSMSGTLASGVVARARRMLPGRRPGRDTGAAALRVFAPAADLSDTRRAA